MVAFFEISAKQVDGRCYYYIRKIGGGLEDVQADQLSISRRLRLLKDRHQQLDDEVDQMSELRNIGPQEYQRLKELKVLRLQCRDAIDKLKRESGLDYPQRELANDPVNW